MGKSSAVDAGFFPISLEHPIGSFAYLGYHCTIVPLSLHEYFQLLAGNLRLGAYQVVLRFCEVDASFAWRWLVRCFLDTDKSNRTQKYL